MTADTTWEELRSRCDALEADAVLVTPASERPFRVESFEDDGVAVRFLDSDERRTLWRTQFEVLTDRLESDPAGVDLADVPTGVEPYVTVVSLSPRFGVGDATDTLRRLDSDGEPSPESPFVRPEWTTRAPPERVHDDSLLLADVLERHDAEDLNALSTDVLVDLYVLLSDVQRGADRFRRDVGDALLAYIDPDARLHSRFGTVHRTTRERRRLKDEETVLDALDEAGIPHEWVLGVDPERLDVVLAVTDLDPEDVYDFDEQVYVQKTAVEEEAKQTRLQGLRDRLAGLETEEAEELRRDIEALESRLDSVLATG